MQQQQYDMPTPVRMDKSDFHVQRDPYAFQDWSIALEDYLEWVGLSPYRNACVYCKDETHGANTCFVGECRRMSSLPLSTTHLRLGRDEIQIAREVWG
jgi:hypothetical protein